MHAILCTATRGRAANYGGALRLILDDSSDVPLKTGKTALYGGISGRRFGSWKEASAALQPFAAAFAGIEPKGEVVLQGQRLEAEGRVWVAGVPGGSYRDGVPESLVAVAISQVPFDQTSFAEEGNTAFEREANPHQVPPIAPHPLRLGAHISAIVALASALGIAIDLVTGGPTIFGSFVLIVGLYAAILAVEFFGRIAFVPTFLDRPSASLGDRRPVFKPPGLLLWGMIFALMFSSMVPMAAVDFGWSGAFLYLVGFASVAPVALLRSVLYARRYGVEFLEGMVVTRKFRSVRPEAGVRGRLSGRLAQGQEFTRREVAFQRSKHLGTELTTDEKRRVYQHARFSTWLERKLIATGPSHVRLLVGDREVVSTQEMRTTAVGLRSTEPPRGGYLSFEGTYQEGDPATLIGAVRAGADDTLEVEARYLVLGDFAELRLRVYAQLVVFMALLGLVAVGCLAFVV
ncbi:MAG TPA: hypothetical protein ENJ18_10480 [Nannocystis exedens]|nr:hypothetical protein [Nannocystis exedens]